MMKFSVKLALSCIIWTELLVSIAGLNPVTKPVKVGELVMSPIGAG
jgi:hypothetical protein